MTETKDDEIWEGQGNRKQPTLPAPSAPKGVEHESTSATAKEQEKESGNKVEEGQSNLPAREEATEKKGIYVKGLGNLDELAKEVRPEDDDGEGDKVVILHHRVTGIEDKIYSQGQVTFVSNLAPSWGKDKRAAAQQLNRLFELGAIRMAASHEAVMKEIEVGDETEAMSKERFRTAEAEALAAQEKIRADKLELELAELRKGQTASK